MEKEKRSSSMKDRILLTIVILCIGMIVFYQGQTVAAEMRPEPTPERDFPPVLNYTPNVSEEKD